MRKRVADPLQLGMPTKHGLRQVIDRQTLQHWALGQLGRESRAGWQRAVNACMGGRGYTVQ